MHKPWDMSTSLIKPTYLVKLSTKEEGGQDSRKSKKWSTWFVHDPYAPLFKKNGCNSSFLQVENICDQLL